MASWGPKLYQSDIAQDVRDEYTKLLKCGKDNDEATYELINSNAHLIEDLEDGPLFWFALADTQWKLGRLLPFVKEKAIESIKLVINLKNKNEQNMKESKIREVFLQELLEQLNSPMPFLKKISKYSYFKNNWNIGDTFAFKLENEYIKENGLYGHFLIIHKVDDFFWEKGRSGDVFPIVYIKLSFVLPKDLDEINQSEFLRFMHSKSLNKSYYRMKFLTKKQSILKNLIYLGNYNITPPKDENAKGSISYFELNDRSIKQSIQTHLNLKNKQ